MEKLTHRENDIRTIFSDRLERLYKGRKLEDHPGDFNSMDEILDYLQEKYPFKNNEINDLRRKLVGQNFKKEQLYKIAILLDDIASMYPPISQYELNIFALSTNENWQKEELRKRLAHIHELQDQVASYKVRILDLERQAGTSIEINEPEVNTILSRVRNKFSALLKKEEEKTDEELVKATARNAFFVFLNKKPDRDFEKVTWQLEIEGFDDWFEYQKRIIKKHQELSNLLLDETNRNKLFNLIYNTPVFAKIIFLYSQVNLLRIYQHLINLITEDLEGILSFHKPEQEKGKLTLTDTKGALTEANPEEN